MKKTRVANREGSEPSCRHSNLPYFCHYELCDPRQGGPDNCLSFCCLGFLTCKMGLIIVLISFGFFFFFFDLFKSVVSLHCCVVFLQLQEVGATLQLWCEGFSLQQLLLMWNTGSECKAEQLWSMGLVAPQHVGSSWTRGRTGGPYIARWILNHWTTREAHSLSFE